MSNAGVKRLCVGEEDKQIRSDTTGKQWCDLPYPLLSRIADGLGLIDLLSFRAVCKDWRSASSEASAKVGAMCSEPWFLMYGEGSQCSLLSNRDKLYTLNIPELDGAICVSSSGGWLLLFKQGSMFFFCPFSRAKIDLPKCPFSEIGDLSAAAFSSPPTSQDCTVAVVRLMDYHLNLVIYLLFRGDNQWVKHDYFPGRGFHDFGLATYHKGTFHIFDSYFTLVTFVTVGKDIECESYYLTPKRSKRNIIGFVKYKDPWPLIVKYKDSCPLMYFGRKQPFLTNKMAQKLGLAPDVSLSISTCGTKVPLRYSGEFGVVIYNEKILTGKGRPSRDLKGVWIQPRYFQISPDQSWCDAPKGRPNRVARVRKPPQWLNDYVS